MYVCGVVYACVNVCVCGVMYAHVVVLVRMAVCLHAIYKVCEENSMFPRVDTVHRKYPPAGDAGTESLKPCLYLLL